jgi:hypothetical protein
MQALIKQSFLCLSEDLSPKFPVASIEEAVDNLRTTDVQWLINVEAAEVVKEKRNY